MLTRNHRQEVLCRAYLQAVAGRCGMSCTFRDLDYGIDATHVEIRRRNRRLVESGFRLDVQAKSTTVASLTKSSITYDLSAKNYEDLRDPEVGCPRILVLLILPEEEDDWLEQTEDHLLIRRAAYWLSLRGLGPSDNERSVRLSIPRTNLFSAASLMTLVNRIHAGEIL